MKEIRPIVEQKGRRPRLMKCLKDLEIEVCYELRVKLKHKRTGRDCFFHDIVENKLDDESKREFLREFEKNIKDKYPDGIRSDDIVDRYLDYLRESWTSAFNDKVNELKLVVDKCFKNEISSVLNIGENTKIRLKSFCTFEVICADSSINLIKD